METSADRIPVSVRQLRSGEMVDPSQYDVVLLPSYAEAVAFRKRAASSGPDLFGVTVSTFAAWVSDLWELYGDGRALVTSVQREAAMRAAARAESDTASAAAPDSLARVAVRLVRTASGLEGFERAVRCSGSTSRGQGGDRPDGPLDDALPSDPLPNQCARDRLETAGAPHLAPAERDVLATVAAYYSLLSERGLVEVGLAVAALPDAMGAGGAEERPLRVLLDGFAPLTHQQLRFFSSFSRMQVDLRLAPGSDGPVRAPEGASLRFAFPSGRYAWPAMLADIAEGARPCGPVVVTAKEPCDLYGDVAPALVRRGLSCALRARRPFDRTDFGRAFLSVVRFLGVFDASRTSSDSPQSQQSQVPQSEAPQSGAPRTPSSRLEAPRSDSPQIECWNRADLADFLLSPFSGAPKGLAFELDARVRGDRTATREEVCELLRGGGGLFDVMEELARDPEANILAGVVEDEIRKMVRRPEAWRREQIAAVRALREVTDAARLFGLGMDACIDQLSRATIDASREMPAFAGEGDEAGTKEEASREQNEPHGSNASARQTSEGDEPRPCTAAPAALSPCVPDVLITDQRTAATFGSGSCGTLVVSDLSSAAYPVADPDDAAQGLLAKLGIARIDSALAKSRRAFWALERLPRTGLVLERCLNDENADPAYPAAVLEEFVDCYRDDPSATDDIDNPYALPPQLRQGIVTRGEDVLYENAAADGEPQSVAAAVRPPRTGAVSKALRPLVVLPRVLSGGEVLSQPCLSPSQIESYLECPYKWFAQRRLRLDDLDEGFGPLEMGDFAHNALRSFYAHFQEETGLPKVTRASLDKARAIMRDVLDRHAALQTGLKHTENRLIPTTELERRELAELERKLVSYLDYEVDLLPSFHPVHLEYDIAQGGAVDYAGCKLVGTADRIDVDDAGRAVVIDYKGSIAGGYALSKRTPEYLGKVQSLIYAQVIRRTLGLSPVAAVYVCYGSRPAATGAFDAAAIDAVHLPGIRPDDCSWRGSATGAAESGAAGASASDAPAPASVTDSPVAGSAVSTPEPAFFSLLDETEERVAIALERMLSGDVEPRPATDAACAWCPVASCPQRRN